MTPYRVQQLDAAPFLARLNTARITGPLVVTPAPYTQSTSWRASSLPHCLRQVGYGLLGYEKTHDTYVADYQLSADIGTAIHTRIQEQLVASGLAVTINGTPAIEVHLAGAPFSGHIDAVIRTLHGTLALVDIKSGGPREFVPGYRYLGEKQQAWAVQVSAYMAYFTMPDGGMAREAYILHINRGDTAQRNLFRIPFQMERWEQDFERLESAQLAVGTQTLPEPKVGACRSGTMHWDEAPQPGVECAGSARGCPNVARRGRPPAGKPGLHACVGPHRAGTLLHHLRLCCGVVLMTSLRAQLRVPSESQLQAQIVQGLRVTGYVVMGVMKGLI